MSEKSEIQWTDATWNPVRGCTKVSPGCAHCYAETFAERFRGVQGHPYEQGFDLRLVPEKLQEPLKWTKPRRIFVNSMSDLFQEGVPDQYITDVFGVMALAHWHTFQVLTKRPDRMREWFLLGDHGILRQFMLLQQNGGIATKPVFRALDMKRRDNIEWRWPLPNVWIGVSVENQRFADERIPLLLQTPAVVRFISAEPLLGPVELERGGFALHRPMKSPSGQKWPGLDWVIVGGESGRKARPFNLGWARTIVSECRSAGVPVFVKQFGAMPYEGTADPYTSGPEARNCRLYELDIDPHHGGDMVEWPEDLRVREFPAEPR